MHNIIFAVIAAAVAAVFVHLDSMKDQSRHGMSVEKYSPSITTIPYELRGYYLRFRPEQRT